MVPRLAVVVVAEPRLKQQFHRVRLPLLRPVLQPPLRLIFMKPAPLGLAPPTLVRRHPLLRPFGQSLLSPPFILHLVHPAEYLVSKMADGVQEHPDLLSKRKVD